MSSRYVAPSVFSEQLITPVENLPQEVPGIIKAQCLAQFQENE